MTTGTLVSTHHLRLVGVVSGEYIHSLPPGSGLDFLNLISQPDVDLGWNSASSMLTNWKRAQNKRTTSEVVLLRKARLHSCLERFTSWILGPDDLVSGFDPGFEFIGVLVIDFCAFQLHGGSQETIIDFPFVGDDHDTG